ncbi:zinc-binding dehydrogenase [Corynebacterium incognita]|uniref:Zinc-binding dehydrogenase n=1 Tax=Corynebacterium incognita TaxID=2754725 RepID=A0A7G7CN51_9CORY|nr:zinc-binding dehydrogenase [Corynebacterium incognita]QNE89017.1 zinc-binding dehydrogenase [Corynebacterium incognita]
MKQWVANKFGEPAEVLTLRDANLPSAGPGEAVVRVLTASLALPDLMMVKGNYPMVAQPPVVPGQEVVGIVEEAGEGFPHAVGTRVVGGSHFDRGFGGFGEYSLMPAWSAFEVLDELTDEQAVGFVGSYHLAHIGLFHRAHLKEGETVLVLGGAGRTGSAAIQVAKAMGVTVIATARSEESADFCVQQGADFVVSRADELPEGVSIDVIYDTVGATVYKDFAGLFNRGARLLLVGFASGTDTVLDTHDLLMRDYSAVGVLSTFRTASEQESSLAALSQMLKDGVIDPPVAGVWDFADVPRAMQVRSAKAHGQSVIRVST